MVKHLQILFVLWFGSVWVTDAAPFNLNVKKDLRPEWSVYENNQYLPYAESKEPVRTIYFTITPAAQDFVKIQATHPFSIFMDGKLIFTTVRNDTLISVQSLLEFSESPRRLLLALHHEELKLETLKTFIVNPLITVKENKLDVKPRPVLPLQDFILVGMLILLVFFIVVMSINPKLASDYFSIIKMFSLRESEDNQAYSRITNRAYTAFYLFTSLLIGYYIMIVIQHLPEKYSIGLSFKPDTFGAIMLYWLELSLIILAIFIIKFILVHLFSWMFDIGEIAGLHFFNWVRVLLVFFSLLTFIVFAYMISQGHQGNPHILFFFIIGVISAGWIVLIYLKLTNKVSFSMFHLFSYICATEFLPLLITLKVLYN